jgi:antitoxin (DNA-binding transcriptional repressor) of toxin-antitoxin stability system
MRMADVSARDLRNYTAGILRRAEAGEHMRVTVSRRPVAQLGPLERDTWASGAAMERILREAPADAALLSELAVIREQTVEPR